MMRIRPVVMLAVAAALLGACSSGTRSVATKSAPTTKAATTTKAKSTTPVTDLNGHVIVGVKAKDVQAEAVPDKPLDRATHALLAKQLIEARAVAMKYPTVAAATAAGHHLVGGGFGPRRSAHGFFMPVTGWMVHAWVVPGWESPRGVFSHENPDLPCADGTFHTDKIGRCQGS